MINTTLGEKVIQNLIGLVQKLGKDLILAKKLLDLHWLGLPALMAVQDIRISICEFSKYYLSNYG